MTGLMKCARTAAKRAYCPYSKFHVGCAIKLKDGRIFSGCNVENASYGLTICAERNAVFNAVAHSDSKIEITEIAITCPDLPDGFDPKFSMSCGACRQVLSEFAVKDAIVDIERVGVFKMSDLLPCPFEL